MSTLKPANDALQEIDAALKTVMSAVSHREAHKQEGNYINWAEQGEAGATHGNDRRLTQYLWGTIDYFTRTEYDENVQKIQLALSDAKISWILNTIQGPDERGYTHYEWIWQIKVNPYG